MFLFQGTIVSMSRLISSCLNFLLHQIHRVRRLGSLGIHEEEEEGGTQCEEEDSDTEHQGPNISLYKINTKVLVYKIKGMTSYAIINTLINNFFVFHF